MPPVAHKSSADSRACGVSLWRDERTRRGHPRWQRSTNRKLQEAAARYHVARLAGECHTKRESLRRLPIHLCRA